MMKKLSLKAGCTVKVVSGKHRHLISVVKKIDRKKGRLFLDKIAKVQFVLDKNQGRRVEKQIPVSVNISNVEIC